MFKHIKLTTATSSWNTCINPNMSNEEIENHFLNKFFDVAVCPIEKMEQVVKVEFLTDYIVSFDGKFLGAIGLREHFDAVKISGYNFKEAELTLYNKYDHLLNVRIVKELTNIS